MDGHEERAYMYRQKAEELRVVAIGMKDPENRKMMLKMADDYDRLARIQDHMASDKTGES